MRRQIRSHDTFNKVTTLEVVATVGSYHVGARLSLANRLANPRTAAQGAEP
jgi:hypothetical protein